MVLGLDKLLCTSLGRLNDPFKPKVAEIPPAELPYHHFVA
jgi:hypothetical protein